jgi:hypothetical protein
LQRDERPRLTLLALEPFKPAMRYERFQKSQGHAWRLYSRVRMETTPPLIPISLQNPAPPCGDCATGVGRIVSASSTEVSDRVRVQFVCTNCSRRFAQIWIQNPFLALGASPPGNPRE